LPSHNLIPRLEFGNEKAVLYQKDRSANSLDGYSHVPLDSVVKRLTFQQFLEGMTHILRALLMSLYISSFVYCVMCKKLRQVFGKPRRFDGKERLIQLSQRGWLVLGIT